MPINPILSPIDAPQMPYSRERESGEVVGKAVEGLTTVVGGIVDSTRISGFATEVQDAEDKYNTALKADQERLKRELDNIDRAEGRGPVAEMAKAMAKTDLLKSQKKVDDSMIAVMKEDIFRRWANRYPSLAPDFIEVAKSSGLGTNFVSKETEFVTKEYNAQLAAEADSVTSFEEFEKAVAGYGLVRSDPRWADDPIGFIKEGSNMLALDRAAQTSERLNKIALNDKNSNEIDADKEIGEMIFENQDAYRNQIMGNVLALGNAFQINDSQLLAQFGVGSIPEAQAMAKQQVLANRDALRKRLMQPYLDRGVAPKMDVINGHLDEYVKEANNIISLFGASTFSEVVNTHRRLVEIGAEDSVISPEASARLKFLTQGAQFSNVVSSTMERFYAQVGLATAASASGIDTGMTYSIRDKEGNYVSNPSNTITDLAGPNGKNVGDVYTYLYKAHIPQIRAALAQTDDPELQRTALMDLVDKAEAFKALYDNNTSPPDKRLVEALFSTLTSDVVPDVIALGGYDAKSLDRIEKALTTLAQHEAGTIGNEALEALKEVRATFTGERPLTEAEKNQSPPVGMVPNLAPPKLDNIRVPRTSRGDIYLDIDKDYRVFFASSTEEGKAVAASLTSKFSGRMTTYTKGMSRFFNGSPEELLNQLTLSTGSKMPREFIKPDDTKAKGKSGGIEPYLQDFREGDTITGEVRINGETR